MSLIYSSAKKDFLYWNVLIFIMELPNDVKVQFYELRKKVQSFNQLSKRFGMDISGYGMWQGELIVIEQRALKKERIVTIPLN